MASFVTGAGSPPTAGTRSSEVASWFANTMTPSLFHAPPRAFATPHNVSGCLPTTSIVLSLLSVKKPMDLLSGDQKGSPAPSVPGSGRGAVASHGRTHSMTFPASSLAVNAICRPSGEMRPALPEMIPPVPASAEPKMVLSGDGIWKRRLCGSRGVW